MSVTQPSLQGRTGLEVAWAAIQELYEHPRFGAWPSILSTLNTLLLASLERLSQEVPAAQRLCHLLQTSSSDQCYLISTDPVVQTIVNRAVQIKMGVAQASPGEEPIRVAEQTCDLLATTLEKNTNCFKLTPLQYFGTGPARENYIGAVPFQIVFWRPQAVNTSLPLAEGFQNLYKKFIENNFAVEPVKLRQPSYKERVAVSTGLKLLKDLSNRIAIETLAHVRVIGLVDLVKEWADPLEMSGKISFSGSNYIIPSSIFLSPLSAHHPIRAAQALFHETTHQKAGNLVTAHSIFQDGYDPITIPGIEPFWHASAGTKVRWPVDRSFFALHYYVHSIPFYILMEQRWEDWVAEYGLPVGQEHPAKLIHQGLERATFLHDQISLMANDFLDQDGLALLDWLGKILQFLILNG